MIQEATAGRTFHVHPNWSVRHAPSRWVLGPVATMIGAIVLVDYWDGTPLLPRHELLETCGRNAMTPAPLRKDCLFRTKTLKCDYERDSPQNRNSRTFQSGDRANEVNFISAVRRWKVVHHWICRVSQRLVKQRRRQY